MTLKVQKSADDGFVMFTVSGRIQVKRLEELQKLFELEASDHNIIPDLKGIKDREPKNDDEFAISD